MLLHELRPSAEYRLVGKAGLTHRPIFTVGITLDDTHRFEGVGKTKKEARVAVAEKCVQFLLQHPEYIQKSKTTTGGSNCGGDRNEAGSSSADADSSVVNETTELVEEGENDSDDNNEDESDANIEADTS
jgi:hypothetical protein